MRELHLRKSFIAITLLTIIFVAFGIVGMPIDVEAGLNDSVPVGYTPIKTISDLYAVNDNPSGNYILMNDIDMSETRKGGSWDLGSGWEPIKEFSGIFDGNGHTLLNLHMYIASEDNYNYVTLGLFSEVDGKVINLGLSNIDIIFEKSDEYDYYDRVRLGVITGILDRSGEINGCYTEGTVSIKSGFRFDTFIGGGIAGSSDGNIKNCYSAVEYICDDNVYSYLGYEDAMYNCGLCGFSSYGTIENCYFAGATDNSEYCITADAYSYQINNVYFLSSNLRDSDGYGKPLSSIQMQRQEMFQGFDFTNDWIIDPNSGYPYPQLLNCMQVKINSAKLSSLPSKREYLTTDKEITINGIYWDITYENGKSSKIPLTQEMLEYEMKPGEQTVKVKWGKYQEEFTIKVKKNVPTLEIEEYDIKKVGDTVTLKPKTNSNGKISYSSDSYGKATVNSSGKVVFNQAGRIPVTISVDETSQFAAIEKTIYFDVRGIVPYIKIKEEFSATSGRLEIYVTAPSLSVLTLSAISVPAFAENSSLIFI